MDDMTRKPGSIWADDLFARKLEAEHLIAYIESVMRRPIMREDKRAYTIAIDARYGEGKTFFLRRLAEHLALNHPVAFIDAWADDLTDEPLTALAATLKRALEPFVASQPVRDRLADFLRKSGRVAKIISLGALRRGAGMLITGKAVDAAETVLSGASDDLKEAVDDQLGEMSQGAVEDAVKAVATVGGHSLMEERIAAFESGKAAVQQMKESLEAIVRSLDGTDRIPPIVIVIDELDRCRPTYAVRLLEEIKHLFDVSGIVFILALHADQLAHSVCGAYGAGFDGRAYLRRFIDRDYRLAEPQLRPLLDKLMERAGIPGGTFIRPAMAVSRTRDLDPTLAEVVAEYMRIYGLGARDAFHMVDVLQTSATLAGQRTLELPYFLALAIGMIKGLPPGALPAPVATSDWVYMANWSRISNDTTEKSLDQMARDIDAALKLSPEELEQRVEASADYAAKLARRYPWRAGDEPELWSLRGYARLLSTVSRFNVVDAED